MLVISKDSTCTKVLIMDITKLINPRGTPINSRHASCAQHLIPFQKSRGIITDTVVGIRGRLFGREPSLRSSIATLFRIPRLWRMKTPVWLKLNSTRQQCFNLPTFLFCSVLLAVGITITMTAKVTNGVCTTAATMPGAQKSINAASQRRRPTSNQHMRRTGIDIEDQSIQPGARQGGAHDSHVPHC